MRREWISKRFSSALLVTVLLMVGKAERFATALTLEGQNKGDNNWYSGNLQDWQELDFIPCRVHWSSAQGNNQTIQIDFPHRTTGVPGFQDLFSFSSSANVVFA